MPHSSSSSDSTNGELRPVHVNHPHLYFADGDIVVRCRSPGQPNQFTYFRVHKSTLEKSLLLRNVLAIPRPFVKQEYHDNLPIVNSNDDPLDVATVLKYVYEPSAPLFADDDPDVAYTMYGALKMADKFLLDDLKDLILAHIRRDWPTTLAEWDARETVLHCARWRRRSASGAGAGERERELEQPEPSFVIRVANEFMPDILPTVFYHLARTSVDASSYYCPSEKEEKEEKDSCGSPQRSARAGQVKKEDRLKALAGRERMLAWVAAKLHCLAVEERARAGGGGGGGCHPCSAAVQLRVLDIQTSLLTRWDPLNALNTPYAAINENLHGGQQNGVDAPSPSLCAECEARWSSRIAGTRAMLFESLGDFFPDL